MPVVERPLWLSDKPFLTVLTEGSRGAECAEETLGLQETFNDGDLRAAYKDMVRAWHPYRLHDMAPELKAMATERLGEINAAFQRLKLGPPAQVRHRHHQRTTPKSPFITIRKPFPVALRSVALRMTDPTVAATIWKGRQVHPVLPRLVLQSHVLLL